MPEIRLARPEDLDAIWSLVTRAVRDMQRRGNPQWDEFYPTRTHYVGDQACGELYVCTDDGGRILGAVCINTDQAPEYASLPWTIPGPAVVLHRMAVDPAAQCRGIACGFFTFAEDLARRKSVATLHVDTYEENDRMQRLLSRLGYHPVGEVHFSRTLARPMGYPCFEKLL